MKLMNIFKGTRKVLMPGQPGYDPFDLEMVKRAYESLPASQKVIEIEAAQHLDHVQKSMDAHVEFGPRPGNSAWELRHAARPYQSQQQTEELDAEEAYSIALRQWLAGGSIGKRPRLSDYTARHRSTAKKAEGWGHKVDRFVQTLFTSGI